MEGNKLAKFIMFAYKMAGNDLTEQDVNEIVDLINKKNEKEIEKWQKREQVKHLLPLYCFFVKIKGKKHRGTYEFLRNIEKQIIDGKDLCEEIFDGICKTYMNQKNFETLLEQVEQKDEYEKNFLQYLQNAQETISSKTKDHSKLISPEIAIDMEIAKQKVKKLSTQYINN